MHWQHLGDWRLNKGNWVAGPDGDGSHGVCWPDPKAMGARIFLYRVCSRWAALLTPISAVFQSMS